MKDRTLIRGCVLVFLVNGVLHIIENTTANPDLETVLFIVEFLLYMTAMMVWWQLILKRLLPTKARGCALGSALMMLVWFLMRTIRYRLAEGEVRTMLWYAYYIPLLMIVLFCSLSSVYTVRSDARLHTADRLSIAAAALTAAGVLTNDFHHLAFRFTENGYVYGPLYHCVWILAALLMGTGLYRYAAAERSGNPRKVILPGLVILVWPLYLMILHAFPSLCFPYNFTEISCFLLLVFWEVCLSAGVIPSNTGYREFFEHLRMPAWIMDGAGGVYLSTQEAEDVPAEYGRHPQSGSVSVDRDRTLNIRTLRNGSLLWLEDRSKLNSMNESLQNIGESLAEENDLLRAENAIRQQSYHVQEQNRIYERIEEAVETQKQDILKMTEERRELAKIAVLGAYIKRRSNLQILAQNEDTTAVNELILCIEESLRYLRLAGRVCALDSNVEGMLETGLVIRLYDLFEQCVESCYAEMKSMMVRLYYRDGLEMRIETDPGISLEMPEDADVQTMNEDGIGYVIIRPGRHAHADG